MKKNNIIKVINKYILCIIYIYFNNGIMIGMDKSCNQTKSRQTKIEIQQKPLMKSQSLISNDQFKLDNDAKQNLNLTKKTLGKRSIRTKNSMNKPLNERKYDNSWPIQFILEKNILSYLDFADSLKNFNISYGQHLLLNKNQDYSPFIHTLIDSNKFIDLLKKNYVILLRFFDGAIIISYHDNNYVLQYHHYNIEQYTDILDALKNSGKYTKIIFKNLSNKFKNCLFKLFNKKDIINNEFPLNINDYGEIFGINNDYHNKIQLLRNILYMINNERNENIVDQIHNQQTDNISNNSLFLLEEKQKTNNKKRDLKTERKIINNKNIIKSENQLLYKNGQVIEMPNITEQELDNFFKNEGGSIILHGSTFKIIIKKNSIEKQNKNKVKIDYNYTFTVQYNEKTNEDVIFYINYSGKYLLTILEKLFNKQYIVPHNRNYVYNTIRQLERGLKIKNIKQNNNQPKLYTIILQLNQENKDNSDKQNQSMMM